MIIRWLNQTAAQVPPDDGWLSADERAVLASLTVPKRRADWRLGRWTAKRALSALVGRADLPQVSPVRLLASDIVIRARADGSPEAMARGLPLPFVLSLSHCDNQAMCAVAPEGVAIGCDVEAIGERDRAFVIDWFTSREAATIDRAAPADRAWQVTLVWSAKESALKALRTGLSVDTRDVEVKFGGAGVENRWQPVEVRASAPYSRFGGWWRIERDRIYTVVSAPSAGLPVSIVT